MAQTTLKFDNKDLEGVRKLAKDNKLFLKHTIVAIIKVGLKHKDEVLKEYGK